MGERVIERERDALGHVSTIPGLRRWRDALVQNNAALQQGAYGCALGSLASEVSDHDDVARGALPTEAPIDQLATGLMSAVQGGYMLAKTARVTPMATSIDMAYAYREPGRWSSPLRTKPQMEL